VVCEESTEVENMQTPIAWLQRDVESKFLESSPMKIGVISAFLLVISVASAFATIRLYDDRGGQIGTYVAKYQALRASGENVVIDGTCASACTMILGLVPRNRICVTPRASLAFHSAWDPMPNGHEASAAGTRILWANYPPDVRKWIIRHGGLRSQMIYLRGAELAAIYPTCP
jgi:hypothetical protein